VFRQCIEHMHQACACSNAQSICTDGRTDLRRTTHLGDYLPFGIARRGGSKNAP
jgi:hypothetical protein